MCVVPTVANAVRTKNQTDSEGSPLQNLADKMIENDPLRKKDLLPEAEQATTSKKLKRGNKGRSTLLTGARGVTEQATTRTPTLLGS